VEGSCAVAILRSACGCSGAAAGDTLELGSGDGYVYVATPGSPVSAGLMFYPQDASHFTAFDPVTGATTRLAFGDPQGSSFRVTLPDGRTLNARRLP
jgi:hypothetical protein